MKRLEGWLYVGALLLLSAVLLLEGRTWSQLSQRQAVTPKALYAMLSDPRLKVQVIDLRAYDDDHFLDVHVPGAVPFPDCDESKGPASAKDRVYPYVATVLITDDGDEAAFDRCRARFGFAQNLAGGMTAWSDANLPEDTGEYSAPKASAGGGCL